MNDRESVLIALADEQNSCTPSPAVILACRIYLRQTQETKNEQYHIDWQPED